MTISQQAHDVVQDQRTIAGGELWIHNLPYTIDATQQHFVDAVARVSQVEAQHHAGVVAARLFSFDDDTLEISNQIRRPGAMLQGDEIGLSVTGAKFRS
jgi:hypothetical protein